MPVLNQFDLDSDNDGIADIIEIGLLDVDGDFRVDSQAESGSVTAPLDTDGDGIPDFLDLESLNAANDGTLFDIGGSPNAVFDTNNDGQINSSDTGGGVDLNGNGVDDLIEP